MDVSATAFIGSLKTILPLHESGKVPVWLLSSPPIHPFQLSNDISSQRNGRNPRREGQCRQDLSYVVKKLSDVSAELAWIFWTDIFIYQKNPQWIFWKGRKEVLRGVGV